MSRTREQQAAEHEALALEATHRAANVTSTDDREATASAKHYQDRAQHHTDCARTLRRT